jgi:inhibitor of cysteine peptidase
MSGYRAGYSVVLLMVAALGLYIAGIGRPHGQTPVTVSESQTGTTTTIAQDQSLEIRLPANAGTGYSWALANLTAPLELVRSNTAVTTDRPGGPQTQLFALRPTNTGAGDVVINYSRPWEKDQPPARTFVLHVVVR